VVSLFQVIRNILQVDIILIHSQVHERVWEQSKDADLLFGLVDENHTNRITKFFSTKLECSQIKPRPIYLSVIDTGLK
jgi:hypothetical protein